MHLTCRIHLRPDRSILTDEDNSKDRPEPENERKTAMTANSELKVMEIVIYDCVNIPQKYQQWAKDISILKRENLKRVIRCTFHYQDYVI